MTEEGDTPPRIQKIKSPWASEGKTVLYVVAEGKLLGAFAVEDEIGPNPVRVLRSFIALVSA